MVNLLNRKINYTAPFHGFNIQGYPQQKPRETPVWPQNTGHKMNGATYGDSFFDSEGLVIKEQSVKVSRSKIKIDNWNFDQNFLVQSF